MLIEFYDQAPNDENRGWSFKGEYALRSTVDISTSTFEHQCD